MWYIHINRNIIDSNRKNGSNDPPITIKRGRSGVAIPVFDVSITAGRVRYDPAGILPCGAKVVIETEIEPIVLA